MMTIILGHNWKKYEQKASYLVKESELGAKKVNIICFKNRSKSTKIAIIVSKFSNIFRGSMPRTSLEPFLFLNLLEKTYA